MQPRSSLWRPFFLLAALEAGAAFFALLWVPRQAGGFSFSRLAMLGLLAAFFVGWTYGLLRLPRGLAGFARPPYALLSALLSLTLGVTLFLLRYLDPEQLLPYYQRLAPLLFYLLFLSLQFTLFSLAVRFGLDGQALAARRPVLESAALAFCVLLAFLAFIAVTRIGLTPDKAYWGEPGVPALGWQLGLALLGGLCVLCLTLARPAHRVDFVLPLALWFLAAAIWLSVPLHVMHNSFYAPMDPPADQPFPNSDAGYYDSMAHSLLIGYPYQGDIPTRPLYIVFLATLHLLFGERYNLIIAGQTLVLAIFPVVLYLLGKRLHSRSAGVIVALLAVFREWTTLLISSQTRVSNTKTLLTELPTFFLILLACLFFLRWLERKELKSALAAGGAFGVLFLLRTQTMLILPFLLILAVLAYGWRDQRWMPAMLLFMAGLAVTLLPWLVHNYLRTGQVTFDAPFEYQVIASQYKYTGNLDLQSVDLRGKSLFGILLTFTLQDPGFVLGFIATHFFATQISGLLALPLIEPYNGLFAPLNLYWTSWDGQPVWYNLALVLGYLAIIALGLGAAWKRLRWAALVPLVFSLGYSLANGVARFSGWRYAFPADWVWYFYFGIGAAEIFGMLALLLGAQRDEIFLPVGMDPSRSLPWFQGLMLAAAFALIGALPWLAEGVFPPRYADQSPQRLIAELSASSSVQQLGINPSEIQAFAAQPGSVLQIGRVLYPRFFYRSTGITSSRPWPAYAVRDYARMGFLLLNQTRHDALYPSRQVPAPFPHGADAILLGCQHEDYIETRLILFPDWDAAYLSAPLSGPCSP